MDKRAKRILLGTYWKNGWIDKEDRKTDAQDFEYAKSKGLMFDNITISHDQCISEILKIREKIPVEKPSKAFLSSLTTKQLDWRSGIASYFIAQNIKEHKYSRVVSGHGFDANGKPAHFSYTCGICKNLKHGIVGNEKYINEDINVLNFERIKWGGVRHGDILYVLIDLRILDQENITEPTNNDIAIFNKILEIIESSQLNDFPGKLRQRLSDGINTTKNETTALMEILACIEVLKPGSYDRHTTERHDWNYVEFWRGEDKYNKGMVKRYFGKYM